MITFDYTHPKIMKSTFSFPEFVPACKKFNSIHAFLRYSHFQSPVTRLATTIFDFAHPNFFYQSLILVNLYQYANNQFISSLILQIQSILEFCHQNGYTYFLTMLTPKIFNYLLISANLYQHAKKQLISGAHNWDTVNFRVHRPDWPHPFLIMPNQQNFGQLLIFVNLHEH